jgi:outer membrane receptor protein involved in Fe transport
MAFSTIGGVRDEQEQAASGAAGRVRDRGLARGHGRAGSGQDETRDASRPEPAGSAGTANEQLIIVTAQKRAENVQDVPASISVVGGEDLVRSGNAQISDFAGYVPGLHGENRGTPAAPVSPCAASRRLAPTPPSASISTMRRSGRSRPIPKAAISRSTCCPYDLARIEILRGPQGTLYGASTIGGLLKYVTVAPDLDEFSGRAGAELFTINHAGDVGFAVQGLVNVPLVVDRLAISASVAHRATPGWIDNVQTGAADQNDYDQTGGRISLLWRPADALTVRLSAIYQELDQDSISTTAAAADGTPVGNGRSNFNFIPETFRSEFQYYAAGLNMIWGRQLCPRRRPIPTPSGPSASIRAASSESCSRCSAAARSRRASRLSTTGSPWKSGPRRSA